MFHYAEGLTFERAENGDLIIRKFAASDLPAALKAAADGRREDMPPVELELAVNADGWASIVASVSRGGPEKGRFDVARAFHASAFGTSENENFAAWEIPEADQARLGVEREPNTLLSLEIPQPGSPEREPDPE